MQQDTLSRSVCFNSQQHNRFKSINHNIDAAGHNNGKVCRWNLRQTQGIQCEQVSLSHIKILCGCIGSHMLDSYHTLTHACLEDNGNTNEQKHKCIHTRTHTHACRSGWPTVTTRFKP